ncbi:MAG: DUF4339 domain-containing protein [Thermoguttaceae bacterium]|nr:DUF4339 domain-containing protein [Thermoguttaceae bacterium]
MRYFVKLAGKAFGPLEEDKIVEMYQSGRLKDPVEISRDKKEWEAIDNILPPPSPSPTLPILPDFSFSDTLLDENFEPLPVAGEITSSFNDPNDSVWYYSNDGRNGYGPVSKSNLATMLQCDMLKPRSLVWRQGENSRPISAVPELMDIIYYANTSAGMAGGVTGSVQPAPNNQMYSRTFSPNSNTGARSNSNPNALDLLDDPIFRNENVDQGRAPDKSPVGQISRINYILLALFLGQLGIHNFYAKRMDIAIAQLFIGLSNLVVLIIVSFVSLATEGEGGLLFIIPAVIWLGLQIWAIVEMFIVTKDGIGKRMC